MDAINEGTVMAVVAIETVSQKELLLVLDLRVQGLAASIVDLDTESPREPEANVVPRVDFLLHNELCELRCDEDVVGEG